MFADVRQMDLSGVGTRRWRGPEDARSGCGGPVGCGL